MRTKRQSFLPALKWESAPAAHGGHRALGRRKAFRPIDTKQALHVCMRSVRARGPHSMLQRRHCNAIEQFMRETAARWGVRVYRYANVGNHLHLLIKVPSRTAWQHFCREFSGGVAIIVTAARKGAALERAGAELPQSAQRGFWDGLVFTRIVHFGADWRGMARYLIKNVFESAGIPMKKLLAEGFQILTIEQDGTLTGPGP